MARPKGKKRAAEDPPAEAEAKAPAVRGRPRKSAKTEPKPPAARGRPKKSADTEPKPPKPEAEYFPEQRNLVTKLPRVPRLPAPRDACFGLLGSIRVAE